METNAVISGIIESALAPFLSEFPPPRTAFDRCEDIMMPARDGICLATRVFYPSGKGPFPVILIRNPYTPVNDNDYMTQGFLLFLLYGYAVVYQNVRGVFDSQGEWLPFENERNDSLDAARWVAAQPFCDGNIATYGGSYLGHVQWSIADLAPPELKTMYISVFGGDPYPLFYENGMFKLGTFTLWATQMMDVRNRTNLAGHDPDSFQKALDTLPHIEADTRLIDHECGWYRQWITNPDARAAYWREGFWGEFAAIAKGARIPVCLQTGWFDIFLPSAIKTFAELPDRTARGSRLLIGPWHHGNAAGGDLTYPDENRHGTFQLRDALDWFDFHLQNKPSAKPAGGITAYAIGEGAWRTFRGGRIRAAGSRRFFLNADEDGLTLRGNPGGRAGAAEYIYDPSDPVRSLGGNLITEYNGGNGLPECSVAQPPPGWRSDVLSFLSDPLGQPMIIAGQVRVRLYVSTDAADTAFTVKLMEVSADGVSRNIRDGIAALRYRENPGCATPYTPGETALVDIALTDIIWRLDSGSRIRLDISSSNYPAFHRHPNTAEPWALTTEYKIARQTVYTGFGTDSRAEVPHL